MTLIKSVPYLTKVMPSLSSCKIQKEQLTLRFAAPANIWYLLDDIPDPDRAFANIPDPEILRFAT
jgi:hypothetical protein